MDKLCVSLQTWVNKAILRFINSKYYYYLIDMFSESLQTWVNKAVLCFINNIIII